MADKKPTDFLENFADRDFKTAVAVDVASVPKDADRDAILFGKSADPNAPPPNDGEPEDETFKWDESEAVVKKYGQGMWYTDVVADGKTFRYWGKTRTEVTKQLIKAQENATKHINELKNKVVTLPTPAAPAVNLVPDTKLPYDPIAMSPARELSASEIVQIQELWQTDPAKAQRIVFQAMSGCTPEAISQAVMRIDSMFARRVADEAAFQFQANHAEANDWDPSAANTALIDKFLKERGWPVTSNNLEIAFQNLRAQGKLTMPPPEEPETPETPAVPAAAAPTVEEVPPPPPPVMKLWLICCTPGASDRSCSKFRPLSGSWLICSGVTRDDTVAVCVSTRETSLSTLTVCETWPTGSEKSTTRLAPTVSVMPLWTTVWKPESDAETS